MKFTTTLLVVVLSSAACAPRSLATPLTHIEPGPVLQTDTEILRAFVRRLPAGSRVRVTLKEGNTIRGTLMAARADTVIVQRYGRIPEAALRIPIAAIARVQIDQGNGLAKAIGIGAAAGAGAALGVFFILVAVLSD
jgi:hypothetical protein